ncbi:MAG: C40 family peptidase [Bacteroidetes bacterium]|nr:C40 family peptidase [Bacteroidota bacterium]
MNKKVSKYLVFVLFAIIASSCRHHKHVQKTTSKVNNETVKPSEQNQLTLKLNINEHEIKKSKLYSFIDAWYGVPYKYGGCQKTGVDCSCFTQNLFKEVYTKNIARTAGDVYKQCKKIKGDSYEEGDLLFFKTDGKTISHVGVYLKNGKFVHSSTSKGVMISDLNENYYKKCFYAAGKLNE